MIINSIILYFDDDRFVIKSLNKIYTTKLFQEQIVIPIKTLLTEAKHDSLLINYLELNLLNMLKYWLLN